MEENVRWELAPRASDIPHGDEDRGGNEKGCKERHIFQNLSESEAATPSESV
jgi:hypothetical protein